MYENSPAIYRREGRQSFPSSEGTAEGHSPLFQPSLRDFIGGGEVPGDKSPGYCQMFLRNKPEITPRDAFVTKIAVANLP